MVTETLQPAEVVNSTAGLFLKTQMNTSKKPNFFFTVLYQVIEVKNVYVFLF